MNTSEASASALFWRGSAQRSRMPLSRRALDLVGLTLLAPLVILPTLILAFAVFLDSSGSVFFRAQRIGYRGRRFTMLKFRTMRHESPGHAVASADDERITPLGGFLRATRLDELPQLYNVLRGEMSLVGPRPELEQFVALHAAEYREILSVPPGITGPTQLRYAGVEPHLLSLQPDPERFYRETLLPDKVELDVAYSRRRSIALDLVLLARTMVLPLRLALRPPGGGERRPVWKPALAATLAIAILPLIFLLALGSPR